MASTVTRRLKRSNDATTGVGSPTQPPVICYLTKGTASAEWYMWNTSQLALALHSGDRLQVYVVESDFQCRTLCPVSILSDFVVPPMASSPCLLNRDILFKASETGSVLCQTKLVNLCTDKGVQCALFLKHHAFHSQKDEADLGSQMNTLFIRTVQEMLRRKYDVAHHYPLFNRAVALHYSAGSSVDPPNVTDMLAPRGLLDRSVDEHQSLHGIQVTGVDHVMFSRWLYPSRTSYEDVYAFTDDGGLVRTDNDDVVAGDGTTDSVVPHNDGVEKSSCVPTSSNLPTIIQDDTACELTAKDHNSVPCEKTETAPTQSSDREHGVMTAQLFNNNAGVLTDRSNSYSGSFTVHVGQDVTFDDLFNYCVTRTAGPVCGLPPRKEWGSVNPVLLMEDPVDPTTGNTVRRYTITSRGHLSSESSNHGSMPCYNEVFLTGRPVSRLNLDVDLKCCKQCNARLVTQASPRTKRKVAKALVTSLLLVIMEALLHLANVTPNQLFSSHHIDDFIKALGKVAVYIRSSHGKNKLSLRMLWYLPLELCTLHGIEAYKALLKEMENRSLGYVLLSYPKDSDSCGLCDLGACLRQTSGGSKCLKLGSHDTNASRSSAIDRAPYSFRKSVRLPNCYKEDSRFEYISTFNMQHDIDNPGSDDPMSLSVGLSSNPILGDVTCLGSMFYGLLQFQVPQQAISFNFEEEEEEEPDQTKVSREAQRLMSLWGVPVTVRKTGSGLFCVQAKAKSMFPCPIHNRVHSTCKLAALVFATCTKYKCFVP